MLLVLVLASISAALFIVAIVLRSTRLIHLGWLGTAFLAAALLVVSGVV